MKTTLFFSCSMIALSATPMAALAEEVSSSFSWGDVTFQPRVYAGYADYNLKSDDDFTKTSENGSVNKSPIVMYSPSKTKIQFSGPIFGIGATVASGNFFGDLYYQSTPDDDAYSGYDDNQGNSIGNVNAKHYDWAISLGYMITEKWSIFTGYKSGTTEWNQTIIRPVGSEKRDGKFEQDGPFLGVSYSLPIEPGVLNFRAAYAYLNGNFERNIVSLRQDELNLDGNSNAYSLGLSWTQSLTENLGLYYRG